jgi:hypothetical protein
MRQVRDEAQHHRRALTCRQLADRAPQSLVPPPSPTDCGSATGTARLDRPRKASSALRWAIVSTHARSLEPGRRRGYARSAEANVSWKQSSASALPTIDTR